MDYSPGIKAKPTEYKGITFRSTLEARYAITFDKYGILWDYEPKRFVLRDGSWYTPDFYLPDFDVYFEVKGVLTDEAKRKATLLANAGQAIIVGTGDASELTYYERNYIKPLSVGFYKCKCCGRVVFLKNADKNDECDYECKVCEGDFERLTIPERIDSRQHRQDEPTPLSAATIAQAAAAAISSMPRGKEVAPDDIPIPPAPLPRTKPAPASIQPAPASPVPIMPAAPWYNESRADR